METIDFFQLQTNDFSQLVIEYKHEKDLVVIDRQDCKNCSGGKSRVRVCTTVRFEIFFLKSA